MTSGLAINTQGLVHIYRADGHDVAALSGVSLNVAPGEFLGLLGPSGAGKSTLMNLLAGVMRPSAGKIFIGASELSTATERELDRLRATQISLLLQGAGRNLLPYASPIDNVRLAQQAARAAGKDLDEPAAALSQLGLASIAHRPLNQLTPGELQSVALAVAISTRPGLLLADEPTSQLDHAARDHVLNLLSQINTTFATTIVLVTHDAHVAAFLPRTVTIRDGKIGGEGRAGEEYAVVTEDGFLPLPAHVRADLPPGTLVRFHAVSGHYELAAERGEEGPDERTTG